jgi:hypothetical protein
VAVGHHRDGDHLGRFEDDVLPVVHHAPVGPRLPQDGVEPAPARPTATQGSAHRTRGCQTGSRSRRGSAGKEMETPSVCRTLSLLSTRS